MPIFVLMCADKPGALDLRLATRETHLAYLRGFEGALLLAGPFLDDDGNPAGSVLFFEAEDMAAAEAFGRNDPYAKAGLFQSVEIRVFRPTLGKLG